ncbi:MAG: hypothetical protein ACI4MF_02600 [Candidatus Faecivicinus sp.]
MLIKQVSVFLENAPGTLRELTRLLGEGGIDLMALSIADTQNFGIVRIIVSDVQVDPTLGILRSNGYTCRVNNVVCAVVEDRPLGLNDLLEKINEIGISVEYLYSFLRATGENALIILRLSEQDESVKKLAAKGVKIVTQQEIDKL